MDEDKQKNTEPPNETRVIWRSGCLDADKQAVKYISTYLLSLMVLCFAFYMTASGDPDNLAVWVSIISSIIGVYLPSPLPNQNE